MYRTCYRCYCHPRLFCTHLDSQHSIWYRRFLLTSRYHGRLSQQHCLGTQFYLRIDTYIYLRIHNGRRKGRLCKPDRFCKVEWWNTNTNGEHDRPLYTSERCCCAYGTSDGYGSSRCFGCRCRCNAIRGAASCKFYIMSKTVDWDGCDTCVIICLCTLAWPCMSSFGGLSVLHKDRVRPS